MQRGVAGMIVGFWLIAAGVLASPQVFGPDNRALDGATVVADAGTFWVRNGVNLPVLLTPNADDDLRFPDLAIARLLVLDSVTGKPVPSGDLRWSGPDIPESISTITWSARDGRLDLGCRGGESVEMSAVGYRPLIVTLEPQSRRNTILLEPFGDLRISVKPPSEGRLWLADDRDISVISPFHSAAERHEIDDGGSIVIRDLDADTEYQGIVVVPGRTPVVGRIGGLPKHLELTLEPGLAVAGRVLDRTGEPVADGRVRATGAIETLGGFRYRQEMRTDSEGRYTITGLLAGEITIKACAPDHACDEAVVEIADGTETEPVDFRLTSGHDLRLTIQNETGRPAAGATVIDTVAFRKHETDDDGVLIFEGVRSGSILELEVFGAGLRRWQGSIDIDRPEIVLRIPAGGVLSWPILTHRALAPDEVVATWSRLNSQGREIAEGFAVWDAGHELVRADGLDAGPHRLQVRLPGAATLRSEVVEIGPGEELYLAPVVPDAGLAVSGRVLDGATAQPLAGARVSCEPGSPNQFRKPHRLERLQSTLTDADGVFLLEGLDPGSCRAVIRAPGFAPWRRDGVEPDQAGVDLGDIELDLGLTIVGRVLDRSDRPQAGVSVEITENAAYAYFAETTVRTDHDGWFRAEMLPEGTWVLRAGRGDQTARATIDGRSGETESVELRLGGLRLEGEVLMGDRAATGGHLVLTTDGAGGDGVVVMVQSDADQRRFFGINQAPVKIAVGVDGRFATTGISAGRYTVSYTPPGSSGAPVSQELFIPQVEVHRCLIQFSDAGLEGLVVDPDGLPIAGAAVFVQSLDGHTLANGFSSGDGAFVFVGLDPGAVLVGAIHGEFGETDPVDVELRAGEDIGPITLELHAPEGAEVSLTVRSAAGSLSGAPVYLVGAETMTGFTDSSGVAGFVAIEPGRYRPCAAAFGGAVGCGSEIELDNGDRRDVALDLGRGGFVEILLGPMERPPMLRVLTADGIDLTSMLMMVSPPTPGPDGVRIGPLRNDDYRITVAMPEGTRQGTIGTTEGETTELDLR